MLRVLRHRAVVTVIDALPEINLFEIWLPRIQLVDGADENLSIYGRFWGVWRVSIAENCYEFAQKPRERYVLMPTKSALSGRATRRCHRLWCAGASRRWFGLANARPKRQSQPQQGRHRVDAGSIGRSNYAKQYTRCN